jgi:DNA-binding transcriptional MocR family regulator
LLREIIQNAGYQIEHSEGGLYIWARGEKDEWEIVEEFAKLGILITPGSFYNHNLLNNIRISTTISLDDITQIGHRLATKSR